MTGMHAVQGGILVLAVLAGGGPAAFADDTPATGTLSGTVTFQGKVPAPRVIEVTKDPEVCKDAMGQEVQDVVVSDGGGLADVFVEIYGVKKPSGGWNWNLPEGDIEMHQKGCRFHPHVLVVPHLHELVIYSHDPILHNINTGSWNHAQPPQEKLVPIRQKVRRRGPGFQRINCNVHEWMAAWMYVPKTPFYARSAADGSFSIPDLPPGKYKVTASHATLGDQKGEITIRAGETAEWNLVFESPMK